MDSRMRQSVGPAYLFLCLILGGSAQGIWANMALQLTGVALIAWSAAAPNDRPVSAPGRELLILAALALALVAIQLLPLPASLWPSLAGRTPIADGYRVLGLATPNLPISLTPQRSFGALLAMIPPLGLFVAIVARQAYRPSWLIASLVAGAIAGILLGALQVMSVDYASSPWYLYEESSFGLATGFFANGNHMGILLVATLPFLAAILASAMSANRQRNSAILLMLGCVAVMILVGIVLNRSLAAYGLVLPVLAASALLLIPRRSRVTPWLILLSSLLLAGAVAVLATSSARVGTEAATSVQTRQEMLKTTAKAIRDFMPLGSGIGSFRSVYQLYENPASVTNVYVVHAHNDYAELALEAGVPGILLIFVFLFWWARAVWHAWRYADASPYARAASIASAAILVHSSVDFPLRTAAIAAVFAMCLALLAERRAPTTRASGDLRPTRHIVLR
jgi:O-antigen ligase